MWVFLSDAFFSIVTDRKDPGMRLVRARFRGDIERVFPDAQVSETVAADYRYRACLSAEIVAHRLRLEMLEMTYTNFKGSVSEAPRFRAYSRVWETMLSAQAEASPRT